MCGSAVFVGLVEMKAVAARNGVIVIVGFTIFYQWRSKSAWRRHTAQCHGDGSPSGRQHNHRRVLEYRMLGDVSDSSWR